MLHACIDTKTVNMAGTHSIRCVGGPLHTWTRMQILHNKYPSAGPVTIGKKYQDKAHRPKKKALPGTKPSYEHRQKTWPGRSVGELNEVLKIN